MSQVLIIGATSAIARAAALRWADQGCNLFLVARDSERLETIAQDLQTRGAARVETCTLDVTDYARHASMLTRAWDFLETVDVALIAHGTLPDQDSCQADVQATREAFDVNALSVVALLTELANRMEAANRGCLVVVSSVAGDRGRKSNFVYGSAKAAVSTFLSGLRGRLLKKGVRVVDIRPGFVDTPMTAHLPKNPLYASPERVGRAIVRAAAGRNGTVYTPWFWRPIMTIIRILPDFVFQRLPL